MKSVLFTFMLIFMSFSTSTLKAQKNENSIELSKIRKSKFQVDLDIKNIFSGLNTSSLIFKRKITPGKLIDVNAIKLIRFIGRIQTQNKVSDEKIQVNSNSSDFILYNTSFLNIGIGIGYEKQIMHRGFVHYFGFDLIGQYFKNQPAYSGLLNFVQPNLNAYRDQIIRNIGGGITLF